MSFYEGQKVVFTNEEKHRREPQFYPPVGTIGIAVNECFIQWPKGTTSGDDMWSASEPDVKPIRKFKVGDKVVGTSNNYGITHEGWVGFVTRVGEGDFIDVRDPRDDCTYTVREQYFELVKREEAKKVRNEDGKLICAECGCVIEDEDDAVEIDGECYCRDCVDDNFTLCENCETYHRNDEITEIDGDYVCDECRDYYSRYFQCDDCGEWHNKNKDDYIVLADGSKICESCARYGDYHRCHDCYEWFHEDDMMWDDYEEEWYCDQCTRARKKRVIHDYSYKPDPIFKAHTHDTFFTDASIKELLFGVELEIDKGNDPGDCAQEIVDNTEDIYCKHDGSLNDGVEIVSHPCTLEYHMKSLGWGDICDIARSHNFKSQDARTCGLHVHVGRNQMGDNYDAQDATAGKIVLLVDRHWASLVKFSRRTEGQLNHWAARPNVDYDSMRRGEDPTQVALATVDEGRYRAVNLENDATVEFRLFCGTLKVETIFATLQLVSNIVTYAKEHDVEACMNSDWSDITGVAEYAELKDYLKNRGLVEGFSPTERDWKAKKRDGKPVYSTKRPEVGDVVEIINARGSGIGELSNYIGERAKIVRIQGAATDMNYLLDFGHTGRGLHTGNILPTPTGYWVYRDNFAIIAA